MNKKIVFLTGFLGVLLALSLVFALSCEDLNEGNSTTDEDKSSRAEKPYITKEPTSRIYVKDAAPEALSVTAEVSAGTLTYQWYTNTKFSAIEGTKIEGATAAAYTGVSTATVGDFYYYAEITNTDATKDITTITKTSSPVLIRVSADGTLGAAKATITVDTATKYQKITGFGGMSNAWTSPALTLDEVDQLFSRHGFGYNLFRIMIYPYMDDLFNGTQGAPDNDPTAHTRYYDMVKQAKSHGAKVLASPWSPPAEWKTNQALKNGILMPEHWVTYANYLKDYIKRMEDNGAPIDYISIQNEPDIEVEYEGCVWLDTEMRDFVKQYARTIAPAGGSVKIMPGESFNFGQGGGKSNGYSYNTIINDTDAAAAIDLVGAHIYGNGVLKHTAISNAGKEVWMTEHNVNTEGNRAADPQWGRVWVFVKEVHDCMEVDFNAFIWWYAKRFYSFVGDGDGGTLIGRPLYRGYALSHYAKYATGKTRVKAEFKMATGSNGDVFVTAYESDDEITLVLFNRGNANVGQVNVTFPAGVTATSASMVMTQGARASDNAPEEGITAMAPQLLLLSPDNTTGVFDLPPSCIISVKFTKGAAN